MIIEKPILLLRTNLLMPLRYTKEKFNEIRKQIAKTNSGVINNGLFIMAVSFLESMLRETLIYYLEFCPDKLPEKEIKISRDMLIQNGEFNIFYKAISDYIEKMSFKDLCDSFFSTMQIKRPTKEMINSIVEIKDKRNGLIHDNFILNYKNKDIKLEYIDFEFLTFSLDTYMEFLDYLDVKISEKYNQYTKVNLLKGLWHYTFETPLCANFEDYWLVDINKDEIIALKHPEQENGLSHSEKFMLEIWRSQFTNYKVEFLNMSSIDSHTQLCLYLFLKISNNLFLY